MKGVIDTTELTDKQRQFIELRRAGKTYSEIAEQLGISKGTCSKWGKKFSLEIIGAAQKQLDKISSDSLLHEYTKWLKEKLTLLNSPKAQWLAANQDALLAISNEHITKSAEKIYIDSLHNRVDISAFIQSQAKETQALMRRLDALRDEAIERLDPESKPFMDFIAEYMAITTDLRVILKTFQILQKLQAQQGAQELNVLPTSNILDQMRRAVSHAASNTLDTISVHDTLKSNNRLKTSATQDGNKFTYYYQSNGRREKTEFTLNIPDTDKLSRSKTAEKVLNFLLIELNKHVSNGALTSTSFSFPLSALVENGVYKSTEAAEKALNEKVFPGLFGITISGKYTVKGTAKSKTRHEELGGTGIFRKWYIRNGSCYIQTETDIPWGIIFKYFTILPDRWFQLPRRSARLMGYIFLQANEKQNKESIKNKGSFNISMKRVQDAMCLPIAQNATNGTKQIKDEIFKAVEDIEDDDLKIDIVYPEECCTLATYLNNGYLRVNFRGKYADYFRERKAIAELKRSQAEKRQQKIVDQAKAKALANKIEREATAEATGKS